jgi:hypothetical protein
MVGLMLGFSKSKAGKDEKDYQLQIHFESE